MRLPSDLPIVQAPMAGGPSTPALTAAVSGAGGYGTVAAGYLSPDELHRAVDATRALTGAPFGVNLFVPSAPSDREAIRPYAAALQPEADRLGVALGEPRWDDDAYDAKLDVVEAARVHLASFTFGCPTVEVAERLHGADVAVAVTVTSVAEARLATDGGADVLLVQGTEAGGHQASFLHSSANRRTLLSLLPEIREATPVPVIGSGGITDGLRMAAVLRAGAIGVQVGTALLCTPEAGTSAVYRHSLLQASFDDTIVTRAYSGRFARGLANRFALEHDEQAPAAYPEVHHLTRPLRSAATRAGDADVPNFWAGTGWRAIAVAPAASIVRRMADEANRMG